MNYCLGGQAVFGPRHAGDEDVHYGIFAAKQQRGHWQFAGEVQFVKVPENKETPAWESCVASSVRSPG